MDLLFWTSFSAMALLLIARVAVPVLAPDTLAARWLTATIKFGDDEPEQEREKR